MYKTSHAVGNTDPSPRDDSVGMKRSRIFTSPEYMATSLRQATLRRTEEVFQNLRETRGFCGKTRLLKMWD